MLLEYKESNFLNYFTLQIDYSHLQKIIKYNPESHPISLFISMTKFLSNTKPSESFHCQSTTCQYTQDITIISNNP